MPRHQYLQRTARERLASGTLPRVQADSIWGGYGRGNVCSLCGEPIRATEVEFEVPQPADGVGGILRFHIPCHEIWQLECGQLPYEPGGEQTQLTPPQSTHRS
jgi:hypothetical protein